MRTWQVSRGAWLRRGALAYLRPADARLCADLYAIVKTTEKLERAYVRDVISAKDYEPLCEKLIAQFRTLWETLRTEARHSPAAVCTPTLDLQGAESGAATRGQVPDVQAFMAEYNMQCPMAAKRLIYSGLPATVEHGKPKCATRAGRSAACGALQCSGVCTIQAH